MPRFFFRNYEIKIREFNFKRDTNRLRNNVFKFRNDQKWYLHDQCMFEKKLTFRLFFLDWSYPWNIPWRQICLVGDMFCFFCLHVFQSTSGVVTASMLKFTWLSGFVLLLRIIWIFYFHTKLFWVFLKINLRNHTVAFGGVLGPHKHFAFFNFHTFFCEFYTLICKIYTFICKS